MAFEVALRNEINSNWLAYRKVPNSTQIENALRADITDLKSCVASVAIAASAREGIDIEGYNYRWDEEGIKISKLVSKPVDNPPDDDLYWWED